MKQAVAEFYWEQIPNSARVLDLGCASGDLGRFKPQNSQVFGLELNPQLVIEANQYENVQLWDLDSQEALPFPDGFFDAVVAKDILEHLQKPWRTLSEIKRVCRPGGIVLASVICERGGRTWSDYTHVRGFTMQSIRQMFTHAGFQVLGVWRMGGIPLSSRLGLIHFVPYLLRIPVLNWFWTSSYEIKARKLSSE
mgnify:CR=1 FL=1